MAHFNLNEKELNEILPLFNEMLKFFELMQTGEQEKTTFLPGKSGPYGFSRIVDSTFYRSGTEKQADGNSAALTEEFLENAGERDGRFIVVPNVF